MSFDALPLELADCIVSHAVPWQWNYVWHRDPRGRERDEVLVLRLVCSISETDSAADTCVEQFCAIISREMLRKADMLQLRRDMERMNVDGLTAVLLAKNSMGERHRVWPLRHALETMDALCDWKVSHQQRPIKALYFRAACSTMVANKGYQWAYKEIVADDAHFNLPLSPVTKDGGPDLLLDCLSVAAYLGDLPVMAALLQNVNGDPNRPHDLYGYPLYAAACAGQVDAMRLLIDAGADVSGPLQKAAFGSPLEAAARHGHLAAVQCLVDKNAATGFALCDAIVGGHERVAAFILSRRTRVDAIVNLARNDDESPLWLAVSYGRRKTAMQLCTHADLDPNRRGPGGEYDGGEYDTPLYMAIEKHWTDVVEALLSCPTIDVNEPVVADMRIVVSPLQVASDNGYDDIVRLLLARDDIDVDGVNMQANTLLYQALVNRHFSTAWLLLQHPRTNACGTITCHAPLELALRRGYTDFVEHLLTRPEVLGSALDGNRTLLAVIGMGDLPTARRLYGLFRTDLNRIVILKFQAGDHNIVYEAIASRPPGVAEFLVSLGDVDPNLCCRNTTLLCAAARHGRLQVVRHFLAQDNVNVNATGWTGSALYSAVRWDHFDVVRYLLAHPAIDVNLPVPSSQYGGRDVWVLRKQRCADSPFWTYSWKESVISTRSDSTPLTLALKSKPVATKLLLDHSAIDVNRRDGLGRTPLFQAMLDNRQMCLEAVQLLLEHPATDPNMAEDDGWTPLLLAVHQNDTALVDLLLQHPDIDPNQANKEGCTPLLFAVHFNYVDLVERLRQHPRIDVM